MGWKVDSDVFDVGVVEMWGGDGTCIGVCKKSVGFVFGERFLVAVFQHDFQLIGFGEIFPQLYGDT